MAKGSSLIVWANGLRVATWTYLRGSHSLQYDQTGWNRRPAGRYRSRFPSRRETWRSVGRRWATSLTTCYPTAIRSGRGSARNLARIRQAPSTC